MANIYSNCSTLSVGCRIFDDAALLTPSPLGYYSDGTNVYNAITESGQIFTILNSVVSCGSLTTTTVQNIVTQGLQLYIDPSIKANVGNEVYDVKTPSSPVVCGYITNTSGFYSAANEGIFQFNGTDQWINLFNVATSFYYRLTFTVGFTFQIIMRKSNAGGFKNGSTFIGNNQTTFRDGNQNRKLKIYDNAFNTNHFYFENSEQPGPGYTEFTTPDNGNTNWCMYTFISSNATGSTVSLYVNNSPTLYTIPDRSIAPGCFDYLVLGNFDNGGGNSFKGDIGAFTFYNRVLTQSEIAFNFNVLKTRFGI